MQVQRFKETLWENYQRLLTIYFTDPFKEKVKFFHVYVLREHDFEKKSL